MNGVSGWFEARGEIPLVRPPGLREYGPLSDDPERPDEYFSDEGISGVSFALEYCDSHGWVSTRTIRCLGLDLRGPAYLRAFCNVRRTTRSFRVDRIIAIAELRSGRILSGEEHLDLLAPYLKDPVDHRIASIRELQAITKNGVFALLQLAMPEGRLHQNARDIIVAYVKAEAEAMRRPLPPASLVELWIDNLAPPLDAVVAAVDGLLAEKERFVRLLPWLLKVMRTRDDFATQEESVRELIAEVRLHFRRKLVEWPMHARARR